MNTKIIFMHNVNGDRSKLQKSEKSDTTQYLIAWMSMWRRVVSPFYDFCGLWYADVNIMHKLQFLYLTTVAVLLPDLSTSLFYSARKFWKGREIWVIWQHLESFFRTFICICRNGVVILIACDTFSSHFNKFVIMAAQKWHAVFTLSVRCLLWTSFSATSILRKRIETAAIWQHFGRFLVTVSPRSAHAQKPLLLNFRS